MQLSPFLNLMTQLSHSEREDQAQGDWKHGIGRVLRLRAGVPSPCISKYHIRESGAEGPVMVLSAYASIMTHNKTHLHQEREKELVHRTSFI